MWMYCYLVKKEPSDEATEARARVLFPEAKLVVVGRSSAFAFVKADIDLATAELFLRYPSALSGSARLAFVTDPDDLVRSIKGNQSALGPSCDCPACSANGPVEFSMLMRALLGEKERGTGRELLKDLLKSLGKN